MTEPASTALVSDDGPALLAKLEAALEDVELVPLEESRYHETHELFEGRSDQQGRIMEWFDRRAEAFDRDRPVRVLSVGCGGGILDLEIARSLAAHADELHYAGIDPNRVHCDAFVRSFEEAGIPGVRHSVSESTFEDFETSQRFDLVHFVHCLYYMRDPEAALREARSLLAPGGTLVVFHAPCEELNELATRFYDKLYGRPTLFAEDLEAKLTEWGWDFDRSRLDARVDVTPFAKGDRDTGTALRDFIVQVDGRRLPEPVQDLVARYLHSVSSESGGRTFIDHPVDVFVVSQDRPGSA